MGFILCLLHSIYGQSDRRVTPHAMGNMSKALVTVDRQSCGSNRDMESDRCCLIYEQAGSERKSRM